MTIMLGVLLNLTLGLSRVLSAMSRRGVVVGFDIALPVMTSTVRLTWSLSAFTVLIYYAITDLAALRLSRKSQRICAALRGPASSRASFRRSGFLGELWGIGGP